MNAVIAIARRLVEITLVPFDALPEWLALTLLSVLTGVLLLLVVRWTTPQRFVDKARNQMTSAVYETRLFMNDPGRLIHAQGRLIVWSVLYIGTMLPAFIIASLPMGLYFLHLDGRYGKAPVPAHEPIVLRVDVQAGQDASALSLQAPAGVKVSAGPIVLKELSRVYWRLDVETAAVHELIVRNGNERVSKRMVARAGTSMSESRGRGLASLLDQSTEPPLPSGAIENITFPHPERSDTWLGMSWWMYWMVVATVAALALKKPLGVAI